MVLKTFIIKLDINDACPIICGGEQYRNCSENLNKRSAGCPLREVKLAEHPVEQYDDNPMWVEVEDI